MKERVESERHDALLAVVKHYGADLAFAQRIRDLTMQLFRRLQVRCIACRREYADWLEAAAMLHEVGAYINRSGRRRHTHYIIANSELFGYTPVQRRIIAAIARYVGNSLPAAGDRGHADWFPAPTRCRFRRRSRCCGWRARSIRDAAARCASCTSASSRTGRCAWA